MMSGSRKFVLGSVHFDPRSGELNGSAETLRLEPKAAAVLRLLCDHDGAVVSRQELLDRGWGEGQGSDEALTQAIAQIRRALDELGEPELVETLAKRGYRLKAGTPTPTDPDHESAGRGRPTLAGLSLLVIVAAALLIAWIANPHGPRHFVRHALGLGPSAHH